MDTTALNTRVLGKFFAGVHDLQIRTALLQGRPLALDKDLALARKEEVLQATREQSPRSLFIVTAVQPHSSRDASTQTPWEPCFCGSSAR
ncbi:unnamed protein product [Schistocephalus solidus]|uniref:Ubiquitin-like domain-containing protein n=1 Tax=Schistocephalus solidus TaxID=70667 RepID=A0A183SZQ0_SCHSO|nr:unnamed protein product [Schistocephalus solidus]